MAINEKKSFEELLREKVEHHEYPFESSGWAAMQSKLQAQQVQAAAQHSTLYKSLFLKAGKVFVAIVSGSSIIYTALSLSGVIGNKNDNDANNNLAKSEIVIQGQQQQTADNSSANSANTATLNISQSIDNVNKAAQNKAEEKAADLQKNAANNSNPASQNTVANNFSTLKTGKQNNVSASTKHFSADAYMQSEENAYLKQNSLQKTTSSAGKNKQLNNAIAGNNSTNNNKVSEQQNSLTESNKIQETPYIASDKNASVSDKIAVNENANTGVSEVQVETMKDSSLALSTTTDATITSPVVGGKYPEKPVGGKPKSNILWALYAGMNFNQTTQNIDGSTVVNIIGTPSFGINASFPLGNRFAFQAGAQYLSHSVSNVHHESAVVQYAILQDSSVTKTTFTQCKYIEFPVMLKYAVLPRWNIYTGLRTSLLVGAKANISQERYSNKKLVSSTPAEDGGNFAQYNGLRSVDFGIPLGIEYSLHKYVSLSATVNYGLSDFTINKVFQNNQRDKHSSLQLQLNIKPFNK
jgi:hypothetical protein